MGILYPNALVADRYLYFSSFGLCLLAGQAVVATGRVNPTMVRPLVAAVGLVAAVYALTLWQVQHFWRDEIALFGRCIERFPESGFCHNRLGMALQGVGDTKGAEEEPAIALKLDPTDHAAEYDLAMVHAQQGRFSEAARESADALKHLANAPASAWVSLAELYDQAGDRKASETAFAEAHAQRVVPTNSTVRFLIVLTLHNLGRDQEALTQCQLVLQEAPSNPNARGLLQLIERDLHGQPEKPGAPG